MNEVTQEEMHDKVMLTAGGQDYIYDFEQLGVNFDSSEREILAAVDGIIKEINMSLVDEQNEYTFTVKKSTNTRVVHIYPKDGAGN
jgi:hypothetical protein